MRPEPVCMYVTSDGGDTPQFCTVFRSGANAWVCGRRARRPGWSWGRAGVWASKFPQLRNVDGHSSPVWPPISVVVSKYVSSTSGCPEAGEVGGCCVHDDGDVTLQDQDRSEAPAVVSTATAVYRAPAPGLGRCPLCRLEHGQGEATARTIAAGKRGRGGALED